LKKDLERYCRFALEEGASDAIVVPATDILVEDRVRGKCQIPRCGSFGSSANCPPHAPNPDDIRRIVRDYHSAIFLRLLLPVAEMAGPEVLESRSNVRSQLETHRIVSEVEARAFYDGYCLAMGFGSGSCKMAFCPGQPCRALLPGQSCRQPLRARPSMEAVGMNAMAMAVRAGWEIFPLGRSSLPVAGVQGNRLGLVLIH
jgi:predicted metal-binding protein